MSVMPLPHPDELSARNRRVLRVLLAIVAVLVASAFAIGIRW